MEPHVVYSCAAQSPTLALERDATGADNGLLFRKQLIYTGDFVKQLPDGKQQRFSVDRNLLQHWQKEFARFRQNGIGVPLPIKHDDNPENNRGELLELEIADEPDGRASLYGTLRFRDTEAAKVARTANVSVYVPPEFVDGKGNKYVRPIQHVSLTDYPVIPGLEKFQPIVASFKLDTRKGLAMSLQTLAEKMGIAFADKDDATVEADILMLFTTLKTENETLKAKVAELSGEPVDGAPPADGATAASHNPLLVGLIRDNREAKLQQLLRDGKATPAQIDAIKKRYLTDGALTLALSHTAKGAVPNDGFDVAVETLALGRAVKMGEQSGVQGGKAKLADPNNTLLADAKRRREVAEKQHN